MQMSLQVCTPYLQIVEQDNSDESESNGKKRKGLKSTRDRQQEALASGRIKHAHVQPSKLVSKTFFVDMYYLRKTESTCSW